MHTFVDVPAGATEIPFWLYADRTADAPDAMDEQSARWIFPRDLDLGGTQIDEVRVDGVATSSRREAVRGERAFGGSDLFVEIPSGPARRVEVRLRFSIDLAERFGRVGWVGDRVTLAGPWYPVVVEDDAYAFGAPHRVEVELVGDGECFAFGERARRCERGAVTSHGAFVPVVVAPSFEQHVFVHRGARDTRVRVLSPHALYRAPRPSARGVHRLRDIARVDVLAELRGAIGEALTTFESAVGPPRDLDLVFVPSRTEMAANAPGAVLVSDRAYEVFPLEDIRSFHDRAIKRAVFRHQLAPVMHEVESAGDRAFATDLRAVLLIDLDVVRRQRRARTAEELVGWAGFHPIVDQLLYAPQVAFVDVYFGSVSEPDPFRDDPDRARRAQSRGRRIFESARDVLDEDAFSRFARRLLDGETSARDALRAEGVTERLALWRDAPNRPVNYRLLGVQSRERASGWRHEVRIRREGAERPEPVEVRVTDREGNSVTETWAGEDTEGVVIVETPGRYRSTQIDPRSRVPQSPQVAEGHPRRDDTDRLPFRPPLLQGVNLALGATEGQLNGLIDFAVRRKFDLENTFALRLATNARRTGGRLSYARGLGRKRDNNRRIASVSANVGFDRIREGFTDGGEGGYRLTLGASAGWNTRRYFLDPRRGSSFGVTARGGVAFRDDGRRTFTLATSARGNLTMPIGIRHALVLVAAADWVFGDPLAAELAGLGGRYFLRAYETNEIVGRGRAFVVAEHRFTAFTDLNVNALHVAWVRELQLAVFAGAGVVADSLDGRDVVLGAEVGAGVRVHFEYGGVQPAVLSIDLAVPLLRDDDDRQTRPPLTFVLAFDQYF